MARSPRQFTLPAAGIIAPSDAIGADLRRAASKERQIQEVLASTEPPLELRRVIAGKWGRGAIPTKIGGGKLGEGSNSRRGLATSRRGSRDVGGKGGEWPSLPAQPTTSRRLCRHSRRGWLPPTASQRDPAVGFHLPLSTTFNPFNHPKPRRIQMENREGATTQQGAIHLQSCLRKRCRGGGMATRTASKDAPRPRVKLPPLLCACAAAVHENWGRK